MLKIFITTLNIILYSGIVKSANVLIVTQLPSPSHQLYNEVIANELFKKGYNVTMVGCDVKVNSTTYHSIKLEGFHELMDQSDFDIESSVNDGPITMLKTFMSFVLLTCQIQYKSSGLQQLLQYPKDFKFDLIIQDITNGPCLFPLNQRFNYPPTVGITAFLLPPYISQRYGNRLHPSYVPFYQSVHTSDMTFSERVFNYFLTYADSFLKTYYEYPDVEKIARSVMGDDMESMENLERRINLVLSNTHPVLDHPQPLPPNIIPVGGLHAKPPQKLPKDLQDIMDKAKDGVILFSLGTNIRADLLSETKRKAIIEALSKVNQTVLWKFESTLDILPKNVIIRDWLPQNDILGHPNLILFVNHGGALSTQESMYHGKPLVSIPFFADQKVNARTMAQRKLGVFIEYNKLTGEYLYENIKEVISNPIYTNNMRDVSKRFKDSPQTSLEKAMFWIEYAMRHDGADFLNTKARDLPLVISSSWDVELFLLMLIVSSILVIWAMLRLCFVKRNISHSKTLQKKYN